MHALNAFLFSNYKRPFFNFLIEITGIKTVFATMSKHKLNLKASSDQPAAKKGHWALGLVDSMKDPELRVEEDDKVVVIKDKFPKAEFHFLILPKAEISGILSLRKEHEDLLKHMDDVAKNLTEKYTHKEFKIGYHAVPNMQRLHLHVISTDFNSPCLKTKVHWNSFTSPFFKSSQSIREELGENGKIKKMSCEECDGYLKRPLQCHKCKTFPKNMPELKRHISTHS
ncbi:aprataxin [Diprion similis]|uniref:aprataxin n=1 Tax=Diprion similis TaxID=362088 RepID=UPI001EF8D4AE|nr:aprataxin [Diprion similis]